MASQPGRAARRCGWNFLPHHEPSTMSGARRGTSSGSAMMRLRPSPSRASSGKRSEEHTSELQSRLHLVCRLLLEKKKKTRVRHVSCRDNIILRHNHLYTLVLLL